MINIGLDSGSGANGDAFSGDCSINGTIDIYIVRGQRSLYRTGFLNQHTLAVDITIDLLQSLKNGKITYRVNYVMDK